MLVKKKRKRISEGWEYTLRNKQYCKVRKFNVYFNIWNKSKNLVCNPAAAETPNCWLISFI